MRIELDSTAPSVSLETRGTPHTVHAHLALVLPEGKNELLLSRSGIDSFIYALRLAQDTL